MIEVKVEARVVTAKFQSMSGKVRQAVFAKIQYYTVLLEQMVKENLYNKVLHYITGELYSSIFHDVQVEKDRILGIVASSASSKAAPYAAIQEFGGTTKAHVIEAKNAKALFLGSNFKGGPKAGVFFKKVNHPGSVIPARPYAGSAFNEIKDQVGPGIQDAVAEATQ